jgi:hypothetical protein
VADGESGGRQTAARPPEDHLPLAPETAAPPVQPVLARPELGPRIEPAPGPAAGQPAGPQVVRPPSEAAPKTGPPEQPHMVPTEIGDLPSDLWRFMGEEPPPRKPAPPAPAPPPLLAQREAAPGRTALAQAPAVASWPGVRQRQAVAEAPAVDGRATEAPPMGRLVTQTFAPPFIVRDDAGVASAETSAASTGEAPQTSAPELDIGALARTLLPEIKRRLAVEWERGRGRLR